MGRGEEQGYIKSGRNEDESGAEVGAQAIERLLTNKLIGNFIDCWQTLKQSTFLSGRFLYS